MDLGRLISPGMRIAVADGVGTPRALYPALNEAAVLHGDLRLLLGWTPTPEPGLSTSLFSDVRTVMSGWGLRSAVAEGTVTPVPVKLSAIPALLNGPLRPDLLVASVVRSADGMRFSSEVSWLRAAVAAGVPVAAVVNRAGPRADAGSPLPADAITVLGEISDPPRSVAFTEPGPAHKLMASHVAALVPEGARVQVALGQLGAALLRAIAVPVRIDSGLLPEQVIGLEERGLLLDEPIATYLAGGPRLYEWADQRPVLHPLEMTHDPGRLSGGEPFVAVNAAIEVDLAGQVNAEGTASAVVGGIGGQADYAAAGARSVRGLSVIALPTQHRGKSTLVRALSRPVSTPSHDVDVLVTERGSVDLRGLSRAERATAIVDLWGEAGVREETPGS